MQEILMSLQQAVQKRNSVEGNSNDQRTIILDNLIKMRSFLIDLMVSIQEQALYESNKPSSHASSLSDELGSLIELVTT